MSELRRALTDVAERGTPQGSERLRERVVLELAEGMSSAPRLRRVGRGSHWARPAWVAAGVAVLVFLSIGVPLMLLRPAQLTTAAQPATTVTPAHSGTLGVGPPTLTFDGRTAVYTGPATFDSNRITFTLENTHTRGVGFGWNIMNDGSITFDEEVAWMETHRGSTYEIPPWVAQFDLIGTAVWPDDKVEVTVSIPNGKGLLYVWNAGDQILYPAAHITVRGE